MCTVLVFRASLKDRKNVCPFGWTAAPAVASLPPRSSRPSSVLLLVALAEQTVYSLISLTL